MVLSSRLLIAQELHFEPLQLPDDLANQTVNSVIESCYAFLWLGSWESRYDPMNIHYHAGMLMGRSNYE